MFVVREVVSVFLVSMAMALSLAHARKFPDKLRLDRETYRAVQRFTIPASHSADSAKRMSIIMLPVC